jgi:hypothetical protein
MSHDNNRWLRRIALGLTFASVLVAGRVSAAAATEPIQDPYLGDVFVRPGESLGGPDGGPTTTRSALELEETLPGALSGAKAQENDEQLAAEHALEAQAQGGLSGYLIEVANALVGSAEPLHRPPSARGAVTGSAVDGDQIAIENAIDDARAQGALSAYPTPPWVWTDRD